MVHLRVGRLCRAFTSKRLRGCHLFPWPVASLLLFEASRHSFGRLMVFGSGDLPLGDEAIGVAECLEECFEIFAVDREVDLAKGAILVGDALNDLQTRVAIACFLKLDGIFPWPFRVKGDGVERLP